MARTPPDDTKSADDVARDEILQQRPELKGKSLEAMRRILRREARLSLRPKRPVKSVSAPSSDRQYSTLPAQVAACQTKRPRVRRSACRCGTEDGSAD